MPQPLRSPWRALLAQPGRGWQLLGWGCALAAATLLLTLATG